MLNSFLLDIDFIMPKNIFIDILRTILAAIDSIVYTLISILFRVIFNLANFELVGFYESFEQRIYVILEIFMLFKVTVSLITYLVNPDKISDKEQGVGKVVIRIIMVLVMLIALPTFFSLLTEFQNKLLPVIPRVIIGTPNTLKSEDVSGIAGNMSLTMLQGFAHLKEGCEGSESFDTPYEFVLHVNDACNSTTNSNVYAYDYLPLVSTVVGILAIYVLFSLCITVAIRAFKMIILRMIAPIPVISYVDPKSSKDGAFSNWTKTLLSTWGELFILIGIIYFIVYMIDFLLSGDAWKGLFNGITNPIDGVLLFAFLIIGLLFFAKQAPDFVFKALGIKSKGSFTRMLGLGATALGMGGSVASQFAARQKENPGHGWKNFGASLFGGLAGGAAGANAILTSDKPTWKTGIEKQQQSTARDLNRIAEKSTLGGRLLSMGSGILFGQTRADELRKRNKDLENANKAFKDYKATVESRFDGDDSYKYSFKLENPDGSIFFDSGDNKINWLLAQRLYSAAENGDTAAKKQLAESIVGSDIYDKNGNVDQVKVDKVFSVFRDNYDAIHKEGYKSFAKTAASGDGDSVVYGKLQELQDTVSGITVDVYDKHGQKDKTAAPIDLSSLATGDYGLSKSAMGDISGTQRELVLSDEYKGAMADDNENKKSGS